MSLLNRPKSHESVIADVAALGVQRYCPECGKVHLPPKKPITPQIMPRSREPTKDQDGPEHHDTCPGCVQCGRGQSDR